LAVVQPSLGVYGYAPTVTRKLSVSLCVFRAPLEPEVGLRDFNNVATVHLESANNRSATTGENAGTLDCITCRNASTPSHR
jgi:hypothetical protein